MCSDTIDQMPDLGCPMLPYSFSFGVAAVVQAIEDIDGGGPWWGLLQMPFGDHGPQDVPWPNVPIRFSKQFYTMMQVCKEPFDMHRHTTWLYQVDVLTRIVVMPYENKFQRIIHRF